MNPRSDDEKQKADEKQPAERPTAATNEAAIDKRIEDKIDRDPRDSFPASDPPGYYAMRI